MNSATTIAPNPGLDPVWKQGWRTGSAEMLAQEWECCYYPCRRITKMEVVSELAPSEHVPDWNLHRLHQAGVILFSEAHRQHGMVQTPWD